MRYRTVHIENYKSLKRVNIRLDRLSVFVGPNASGKTNLSEALDFIGEVYRLGLETAVARKGGYENIAFRRGRRAKAPIKFIIEIEIPYSFGPFESFNVVRGRLIRRRPHGSAQPLKDSKLVFSHAFDFKVESDAIDAPFKVTRELLRVDIEWCDPTPRRALLIELKRFTRGRGARRVTRNPRLRRYVEYGPLSHTIREFGYGRGPYRSFPQTELQYRHYLAYYMPEGTGAIRSYQLNPRTCREVGVPTPNPELSRFGANLPAMIPFFKKHHPVAYSKLVPFLAHIFPGLEDLNYHYTHTKTFTLEFKERGFRRSWTTEDVSDGTIQSLAILVAIFDPRGALVVIEEPENSLHPWGIRNLIKAIQAASSDRQIVITTHSPVVVNSVDPDQVRVVSRNEEGLTEVQDLIRLDSTLRNQWEQGQSTLADILDSGTIPQAVPAP